MAQSLSQIYIHLIFHIKNNGIALLEDDCPKMFAYIDGIVRKKGSFVIIIGGMPDHIYILCTLPRTISTADFIEDIKKCSSKWVKTIDSRYSKFAWQGGYGVFSVSDSQVEKTKQYILNQKEHHKHKTFQEEYLGFLKHYHIDYKEEYLFTD